MYKLLIADGSDAYADILHDMLQTEFEVLVCRDGETALEQLLEFEPDALIVNLMLPFKDGLTLLQETAYKPRVILAITPFINQYVQKTAAELGVQFLTYLPSAHSLRVRLMDLIATTIAPKEDLNAQTAILLHSLNFPTHLDGYQQLCVGIPIFAKNPNMRLSKELYPIIAERFGLSDARTVEHSIRKAVTSAWIRKEPTIWAKFFPDDIGDDAPCPSNKEFIAHIAEHLEL